MAGLFFNLFFDPPRLCVSQADVLSWNDDSSSQEYWYVLFSLGDTPLGCEFFFLSSSCGIERTGTLKLRFLGR